MEGWFYKHPSQESFAFQDGELKARNVLALQSPSVVDHLINLKKVFNIFGCFRMNLLLDIKAGANAI